MKKIIIIIGLLGLVVLVGLYAKKKFYNPRHQIEVAKNEVKKLADKEEIKNGDIIFQSSQSSQSKAIQLATKSKYSHCGIIYKKNNEFFVFEAVQPVKSTPLDKWIARGQDGSFVIKRLKNADQILNNETLEKLKEECEKFNGKNYDKYFEWSDDNIYCSELVWKAYQRATGLEIGKLQKLKEFDLSNELVKTKLKERYGENIPMDEMVISPASIFDSDLLTTVITK